MNSGLARSQFNASRDLRVQRLDVVRDQRLRLGAVRRNPYAVQQALQNHPHRNCDAAHRSLDAVRVQHVLQNYAVQVQLGHADHDVHLAALGDWQSCRRAARGHCDHRKVGHAAAHRDLQNRHLRVRQSLDDHHRLNARRNRRVQGRDHQMMGGRQMQDDRRRTSGARYGLDSHRLHHRYCGR